MARLIVKSPYIKCGGGKSAGGYLKYIATRERVEIIPDDRPPTKKQEQLIAKLVKDFPDAKELMEYEDYATYPTKAKASALITLTLETNWDKLSSSGMASTVGYGTCAIISMSICVFMYFFFENRNFIKSGKNVNLIYII